MKIRILKPLLGLGVLSLIAFGTTACGPERTAEYLEDLHSSKFLPEPPADPGNPPSLPEPVSVTEEITMGATAVPGEALGLPAGTMIVGLTWTSVRQLQEFTLFKLGPDDTEFQNVQTISGSSGVATNGNYSIQQIESTTGPYRYYVESVGTIEEEVGGVLNIIRERSNEVEVSQDDFPSPGGNGPDPDPDLMPLSRLSQSIDPRAAKTKRQSDFSKFSSLSRLRGPVRVGSTESKFRFASVPIRTSRSGRSASVNLEDGSGGGLKLRMKANGRAVGTVELAIPGAVIQVPVKGSHRQRGKGVFAEFSGEMFGNTTTGRVRIAPAKSGVRLKAIFLSNDGSIAFDLKGRNRKR